jgi:hypothetical protein
MIACVVFPDPFQGTDILLIGVGNIVTLINKAGFLRFINMIELLFNKTSEPAFIKRRFQSVFNNIPRLLFIHFEFCLSDTWTK